AGPPVTSGQRHPCTISAPLRITLHDLCDHGRQFRLYASSMRGAAGSIVHLESSRETAMGPFPHDAPPASISPDNPAGTDGFEFVEFAHPHPPELERLFQQMGYVEVARHKAKNISLYRQGSINYLIN